MSRPLIWRYNQSCEFLLERNVTYSAEGLNGIHADKSLGAEGAHRTIVAGGGNDDWSVDGVWVHAALVIVVHADN